MYIKPEARIIHQHLMDNVQKLSPELKNAISSLDIELLRVLLHLKENNKGIEREL